MKFALKLKELRERNNISQAKLAHELNVSVGCVGMWESTTQIPPAQRLEQLADYFGVSVDFLLGRETEKSPATVDGNEANSETRKIIKLCNYMTPIQRAQVFGYAVGLLEQAGVNVNNILAY